MDYEKLRKAYEGVEWLIELAQEPNMFMDEQEIKSLKTLFECVEEILNEDETFGR